MRNLVSRSSSGHRSPNRLPTRRARSQWRPLRERNNVVEVEDQEECVDLTADQDEELVIDLTSPTHTNAPTGFGESSIIILNTTDSSSPERRVPVLDVDAVDLQSDISDPSIENADVVSSPGIRRIACPVCMDDYKELQQKKAQLMSTICGHLFCKPCIKASIRSNHRCPTCRKKLTEKAIHPIFV